MVGSVACLGFAYVIAGTRSFLSWVGSEVVVDEDTVVSALPYHPTGIPPKK